MKFEAKLQEKIISFVSMVFVCVDLEFPLNYSFKRYSLHFQIWFSTMFGPY